MMAAPNTQQGYSQGEVDSILEQATQTAYMDSLQKLPLGITFRIPEWNLCGKS